MKQQTDLACRLETEPAGGTLLQHRHRCGTSLARAEYLAELKAGRWRG